MLEIYSYYLNLYRTASLDELESFDNAAEAAIASNQEVEIINAKRGIIGKFFWSTRSSKVTIALQLSNVILFLFVVDLL